ncbi:MAG TPA: hypothetical protein VFO70_01375 [Chitinophagaceae bacterium]|nr:hypothetical protein [Chitinophagaceae bacterium]
MKLRLVLLTLLAFFSAVLLAFRFGETGQNTLVSNIAKDYKKTIARCSPDWEQLSAWLEEVVIPPIAGSGTHKWSISTRYDSAQFYFNQGINMYYSFHIIESMASFKKAEKLDPDCAMLPWAQALAYGPNINDLGYSASPEALKASAKALELSGQCTEKEKLLIQAMQVRYSADTTQTRAMLNQLYVDKLKEAYSKYPGDADVAALYVDAMMLQHPWDLWNIDGTPKPWTPWIREVLEKLLAKHPEHPGANHYYIHVMEPSPYADKALPSADRLGKITPGLAHTVHMPSHIYLRTGNYDKGVTVNENAVNSYRKILPIYAPVTGNDFLYVIHNLHMQANNAMLAGRKEYSVLSASETSKSIPREYLTDPGALGNYLQYIEMTGVLIDIRFARWKELLNRPQPFASHVYSNVLHHFGRGMAYSNLSDQVGARKELEQLRMLLKEKVLQLPFTPFSPAIKGATVAENMLLGTIALMEKDYTAAIAAFREAVNTEENMVYTEPRDWMLNPKHWLGTAYLAAGKFVEAEKIFLRDLQNNNENMWALRGLYNALKAQKKKEATSVLQRFNKAASGADIRIDSAVL